MDSRLGALLALAVSFTLVPSAQQLTPQDRVFLSAPSSEILVCGTDKTAPPIPLRWSTLVLVADGRNFVPCPEPVVPQHAREHREIREWELMEQAAFTQDPDLRWRFLQARARLDGLPKFPTAGSLGFIGNALLNGKPTVNVACDAEVRFRGMERWNPGLMFRQLRGELPRVSEEAAIQLQVILSEGQYGGEIAEFAKGELEACIKLHESLRGSSQTSPRLRPLLIEAIGIVKYADDAARANAEEKLRSFMSGPTPEILGAVKGLEALLRQAPNREIALATRIQLRELTRFGRRQSEALPEDSDARIRRLAFMALQTARDDDTPTLFRAMEDGDWQVRRLIAQRLNVALPEHAAIVDRLARDPAFQVRYEVLTPLSRGAVQSRECAVLAGYLDDRSPLVAMRAMDLLSPSCTDLQDTIVKLTDLADKLDDGSGQMSWHLPVRALTALARLKRDEAVKRFQTAAKHPQWQVRAAAATIAASLGDIDQLDKLAHDSMPNVQTAAIETMVRLKSSRAVDAAIDALRRGSDNQLMRSAALALKGAPEDKRSSAIDALFSALRRLTDTAEDTSRDPRVAILERLGEFLDKPQAPRLQPWIADFDPAVVDAAVKAFLEAAAENPPMLERRRRYPAQPPEAAILRLPREMVIQLEQGTVVITLLPEIAPVTIARVAAAAQSRYYTNLTFHRIVPNFVVQGGSPGANEYVGASRFMRDELGGAPHIRGAVGISTRGRDTGDAQIFIDLVDLPNLDRNYTVFGYVRSGMEYVDRMLEGAIIKSITVK